MQFQVSKSATCKCLLSIDRHHINSIKQIETMTWQIFLNSLSGVSILLNSSTLCQRFQVFNSVFPASAPYTFVSTWGTQFKFFVVRMTSLQNQTVNTVSFYPIKELEKKI